MDETEGYFHSLSKPVRAPEIEGKQYSAGRRSRNGGVSAPGEEKYFTLSVY
jgi:hypothetical protein